MKRWGVAMVVTATLMGGGCGTRCEELARHRAAFWDAVSTEAPGAQVGAAEGADVELMLPFGLLEGLVRGALGRRPEVKVPLEVPGLAWLAKYVLRLEEVRFIAADGEARAVVGLEFEPVGGGESLGRLEVEAKLRVVIDKRNDGENEIKLNIESRDLVTARVEVNAVGARAVADAFGVPAWGAVLAGLGTQAALGVALSQAWPELRDATLGTGRVLEVGLAMHGVPVRDVVVGAREAGVVVRAATARAAAPGLAVVQASGEGAKRAATEGSWATLRVSGETAAWLTNRALVAGELPRRFDGEGEPDEAGGMWEAGVRWRGGERPVGVAAWRLGGGEACTRAEMALAADVFAEGDRLRVEVRDVRRELVRGPMLAEWFGGWDRAVERATFGLPAVLDIRSENEMLRLRVVKARVGREEVQVELAVGLAGVKP